MKKQMNIVWIEWNKHLPYMYKGKQRIEIMKALQYV